MVQDTKTIEIKDFDSVLKFRITLFNALDGLDFLDSILSNFANKENKFSIKPYLNTLLKLATPLANDGLTAVISGFFTLEQAGNIIKNPVSLIELGTEILKFQEVFIQGSNQSQQLIQKVKSMFNI